MIEDIILIANISNNVLNTLKALEIKKSQNLK